MSAQKGKRHGRRRLKKPRPLKVEHRYGRTLEMARATIEATRQNPDAEIRTVASNADEAKRIFDAAKKALQ
jgi:hypothetical protein